MHIFLQPMSSADLIAAQILLDKSFEMNFPYFPQIFCYDVDKNYDDLSLKKHFDNKDKMLFHIVSNEENIGGTVLSIDENNDAFVDLFYIAADYQNKHFGYAAWQAVENNFPQVKSFTLETPVCLIKNACFYVNKCGFSIVEIKPVINDFLRFVFRKFIF